MWIVRLAIDRPYTFVVVSILIAFIGALVAWRMPVDIFPSINIPVVSVIWSFTGLPPEEMESRIMTVSERAMTTVSSDIEHMESTSLNGVGLIRVFLHQGANVGQTVALMSAVNQTILRVLPPGITPPATVAFNATDVPVLSLGVSSKVLTEAQLYDYDLNFIRTRLATVGGASLPLPYGGKQRQVMVDLYPDELLSKNISPADVVSALGTQNVILPAGSARLGTYDYPIRINGSPDELVAFNDIPIKQINGATVYLRDIGYVHDGYAVQTNVVRMDRKRATLLNVLKSGAASTLSVVQGVKDTLPLLQATLPKSLDIKIVNDQSQFVRGAITQVIHEAVVAALLTGLLMLAILGSWRSTLIVAVSIPLSILSSVITLACCGQTLNTMTLGGLALAVGMLVDDATVEVENIHRNLDTRMRIRDAVLTSASQVALPAFVSTISICIVFIPVFLLTEPAKSLFVPLAMAVVFAMMASYFLSRTLVPVMSVYLLRNEELPEEGEKSRGNERPSMFRSVHMWIDEHFNKLRDVSHGVLEVALAHRPLTVGLFCALYVVSFCLLPFIGDDFFPNVDAGSLRLHMVCPAGTRVETTEQYVARVESAVRRIIPGADLEGITENIGVPNNGLALAYGDNTNYTVSDAEMLITLKEKHHGSTFEYQRSIREMMAAQFPMIAVYFQPADITSQILNAGLPAPIDIQVTGRGNKEANYRIAQNIRHDVALIPGAVDVLVRQQLHMPQINLDVDRTRAIQLGLTQRDVAGSILTSLSSSFQTSPTFWVNPQNGVNYNVAVQTPTYKINSSDDIQRTMVTGGVGSGVGIDGVPSLLMNMATMRRSTTSAIVSHYAIQPVFDVYVSVQDRDLGGVSADVQKVLDKYKKLAPKGTLIQMRGQADSMNKAFTGLLGGMALAVIFVYFLLVVNFQSWLDPLIILMALPGAFSGIILALFLTQTTFSVPALMGAIMSIGVGAANSILLVNFANEQSVHEKLSPLEAASRAGFIRFRPVLMTATAMIIGMLPMALGLGEGGGQNAPLGRAVIGGLLVATLSTLLFVPVMYSLLKELEERRSMRKETHGNH